ncbi:MAG: calcium-binding protein, partial [Novosphingobium sp.]
IFPTSDFQIETLKFVNVGETILVSRAEFDPDLIVFSQLQPDPNDPAIPLLVVDPGHVQNVEVNGVAMRTWQLNWLASEEVSGAALPDETAIYNLLFGDGGPNDAGGGVAPEYGGNGAIESLEVRPDITGRYMDYAYSSEYLHPFVITNYVGGPGGCTMTFDSYLQSIRMVDGISAEDVRFTVNSSAGNANLTIHIDALGESHTIQYYESGKTLSGIALYDSALHSWAQGIGGSLQGNGGPGQYTGTYTQEYTLSSGLVQVTYFLEAMHFGNGPSINLQDTMTFTGTSAGETLYGLDTRGDIIKGLAGNDDLRGYGGDDTLIGGTGADQLTGGLGNDTYYFEAGFSSGSGSSDIVYEYAAEGTDKIVFGSGINADEVRTWTDSYGYLYIQSVLNPLDYVRIVGTHTSAGTNVNQRVEQIEFADSTVWDLTQGLILNDSDDGHSGIYGSAQGDIINGNDGDDHIRGWDGDDTINGGAGTDQMYGGLGDDTFVFENGFGGSSVDLVSENLNEGFDTLHFGDGLTAADLHMWTDSYGYLHVQSALGRRTMCGWSAAMSRAARTSISASSRSPLATRPSGT